MQDVGDFTPNRTVFEGGEPQGFVEKMEVEDGDGALGFCFYFSDGTDKFLARSEVFEDYDPSDHDDWFIIFPVSGGKFNSSGTITFGAVNGDSSLDRYDGNDLNDPEEPQTYYMLPVVRSFSIGNNPATPQIVSLGGTYEEDIYCVIDKGPIVRMIQIA